VAPLPLADIQALKRPILKDPRPLLLTAADEQGRLPKDARQEKQRAALGLSQHGPDC